MFTRLHKQDDQWHADERIDYLFSFTEREEITELRSQR